MTDLADREQMVHEAWGYTDQARQFSRMAHRRATLTAQAVQRAYHQASMAWLALSMPKADARTLSVAATILARNGLLDGKPAIRASVGAPGDPPCRSGRRRAGTDDDERFS